MNILFNLNPLLLCLITSFLLLIIFITKVITNKIYFKTTYDDLKNSYNKFLKYIDRYYITNLKYTLLASISYIISTMILFLIIRYLFIGQIVILIRIDNSIMNINYWYILIMMFKYLILFFSIFLYKKLIQVLFFRHIIKLRIYLERFSLYEKLHEYCTFQYGIYISKLIWMLSYRIAKQTFRNNLFEGEYDLWKDNALDYEEQNYKYIYNNFYVIKVINYLMYVSSKKIFVSYIFYYNAKLFKFISRHISNGLFKFMPHMLIFLCLLYELYYRELYFIYYITFMYFIYYIIFSFRKFEQKFAFIDAGYLSRYFYENDFPYPAQRFYIINAEDYKSDKNSKQNHDIAFSFKLGQKFSNDGIIFSILNNMSKKNNLVEKSTRKYNRQFTFLYLRTTIICAIIIINIFIINTLNITITIFNKEISKLFIMIPCLITIILAVKTFHCIIYSEFTKDETYDNIYNVKYSILFWISVIIQSYFYWLILLKPELFFMNTEILLKLPYNILKITKIYSQEEKIMYLYQYFEFYLRILVEEEHKDKVDIDFLRFVIRQIDYKSMIDDLNLKDLQGYIKLVTGCYYLQNVYFLPMLKKMLFNFIEEEYKKEQKRLKIKGYMDSVINYIFGLVFHSYLEAFKSKIGKILARKGIITIQKTVPPKSFYKAIKFIWLTIIEIFKNM